MDHEGEVEHRHHGGMAAVVRGAALELCVRGEYKARSEEASVSHLVLFDIPVPRPILHAGVCFTLATEVMAPIVSTIGVKNPAAAVGSGSTTKSLAGEGLVLAETAGEVSTTQPPCGKGRTSTAGIVSPSPAPGMPGWVRRRGAARRGTTADYIEDPKGARAFSSLAGLDSQQPAAKFRFCLLLL